MKKKKAENRKGYNVSLPPFLVAQVMTMTTNPKDPEMMNLKRSAAIKVLIERGMKAGR